MVNQLIIYFIVLLTIGYNIVTFVRNIKRFNVKERYIYSYVIGAFALWVLSNFVADIVKIYFVADFAARISLFWSVNVSTAIFLLSSMFPQQLNRGRVVRNWEKIVILFDVLLSSIVLVTLYTPLNVVTFNVHLNGPSSFVPGILYTVVFAFSILIFAAAFIRWYSRFYTYTALQREQIKILSTTLSITIITIIGSFVILPAINPSLSPYSILAHVVIALFLIQIQVNILTKNAVVNYRIILKLVTIYLFEFVIVYEAYDGIKYLETIGLDRFSRFLTIPIFFTIILWSLNEYMRRYLHVPAQEYVKTFVDNSVAVYKTSEIKRGVLDVVGNIIPTAKLVYVNDHEAKILRLTREFTLKNKLASELVTPETLIEAYLFASQNHDVESMNFLSDFIDTLLKERIDIVMPILSKGVVTSLIITKEGAVPDIVSFDELRSLTRYASIAFSRASLYEEVQGFAKDLADKVEERTKELSLAQDELYRKNRAISRANAELQSVDKAKSDFISMASHQLRTPISIIQGYLSMMYEGDIAGKLDEEKSKILERVLSNIRQLNGVVEDILNTSRIEQGRLVINLETLDVVPMVRSVVEELRKKAEDKGLKLESHFRTEQIIIALDKIKIHEVFVNLIDNAIAYTPKGKVTVDLSFENNEMHFSVKDTGIGIPPNQGKDLFKRFSRLDNAKKVRPDGSGIGLFTAKTIVNMHGGRIWFESELGAGTTFYISIPNKKI